MLPTFRETPAEAFAAAHEAFAAGVDGVFCYDHIWPMGQPERPALAPFPILGALAASVDARPTSAGGPYFGTLVARVGLVPNAVLQGQFIGLAQLAPGRVIAGLGTGDHLSAAENLAYGIPFTPAAERRTDMVELARSLRAQGLTVWLAGGAAARIAESLAADAALNVWDADPALVADRSHGANALEVTWGGPPPKDEASLSATVRAVAEAGATWAIFGWPIEPALLVKAAREADAQPAWSGEAEAGS